MSVCRFGIIGAGSIGAHFCSAIPLVEGAELVAVARKLALRNQFAGRMRVFLCLILRNFPYKQYQCAHW